MGIPDQCAILIESVTHSDIDTQTETDRLTDRQTDTEKKTDTEKQTGRQTDLQSGSDTNRHRRENRQIDVQKLQGRIHDIINCLRVGSKFY